MNHVLIVEDEDFLVRVLKDNFKAEGYLVETASNGEEAVEILKESKPDVIMLDILMPKKDGFYLIEEVRKNHEFRNIPLIVLSNLGEDAPIRRALEMGADDYFVKSQYPIQEVVEKVKDYLEGRKVAKVHP